MHRCARSWAAAGLALAFAQAAVAQGTEVPVTVGGDGPDFDACGGLGRVVGLNPRGDNFLAVRVGPSTRFTKVDEVYTDYALYLCETRGEWYGVVYHRSGKPADCGVSTPRRRQPYSGPCRSGWVHGSYVEVIAG